MLCVLLVVLIEAARFEIECMTYVIKLFCSDILLHAGIGFSDIYWRYLMQIIDR